MPTKTKKKQPETLSEKITDRFDEYLDVTNAILGDYMCGVCGDEGMFVELAAADNNFKDHLNGLLMEEESPADSEELNEEKMLDYIEENVNDLSHRKILGLLNEDQVLEWAADHGYATIRVENLADKAKLEEFVTTQLYPNYNDKDKYNL